jgi:hypothetical protein
MGYKCLNCDLEHKCMRDVLCKPSYSEVTIYVKRKPASKGKGY